MGRVLYWLLLLPFLYLLTMTDFLYGIASLGYLGLIVFSIGWVLIELYLYLDGVTGNLIPDRYWKKLIPDQEIDRDFKMTVEWLLRLGLYGCVLYGIISFGHHLFDYSHLLDSSDRDEPAYLRW